MAAAAAAASPSEQRFSVEKARKTVTVSVQAELDTQCH